MESIFGAVKNVFSSNMATKGTEIEFRFGKMNGTMFDTNVGKDIFDKVVCGLQQYKTWESVCESNMSVYYKGNTRITINDEDATDTQTIEKKNIIKTDFRLFNHLMDVRMAVSSETPLPPYESNADVMDFIRVKNRISFIRKNLRIDTTIVRGDACDMDDENENRYEIELEIINPQLVTDDKLLYNITYKIFDILKIVE